MRFNPGDRCGGHVVLALREVTEAAELYDSLDGRDGGRRTLKVVVGARAKPNAEARLAQEARALAEVEHAHVARFHDAGVLERHDAGFHERTFWLLREHVEGTTLREKMAVPLPVEDVLRWVRQACDGVAEAHRKGIVHRDLKPENILITSQGIAKVSDSAVAKFAGVTVKTTFGRLIGTPAYMAPEAIQKDRPTDGRMDVYSMCAILYEGLSGANPFGGPKVNMIQTCARQLQYVPPPLASFVARVSVELSDLVQEGLEKDPERRIRTMRELGARVQEELERELAPRRRVARIALLPSGDRPMARTQPMAVVLVPGAPAVAVPPAGPASAASTAGSEPGPAETLRSRSSSPEHSTSLGPATVSTPDLGRHRARSRRVAMILAGVGLVVTGGAITGGAIYLWPAGSTGDPGSGAGSASASAAPAASAATAPSGAPPPGSSAPTSQPSATTSTPAATSAVPATKPPRRVGTPPPQPVRAPAAAPTAPHRIFGVQQ